VASALATLGLRTRVDMGFLAAYPSVGYTLGTLATVTTQNLPTHADLTGFRAQLAIRVAAP
jgi:hypothetical protein